LKSRTYEQLVVKVCYLSLSAQFPKHHMQNSGTSTAPAIRRRSWPRRDVRRLFLGGRGRGGI